MYRRVDAKLRGLLARIDRLPVNAAHREAARENCGHGEEVAERLVKSAERVGEFIASLRGSERPREREG